MTKQRAGKSPTALALAQTEFSSRPCVSLTCLAPTCHLAPLRPCPRRCVTPGLQQHTAGEPTTVPSPHQDMENYNAEGVMTFSHLIDCENFCHG